MKSLKLVLIATAAGAAVSMASFASAGPRPEPYAVKVVGTAAKRAIAVHVAGPRGTIAVVKDDGHMKIASVNEVADCSGHRAGPRATVCL